MSRLAKHATIARWSFQLAAKQAATQQVSTAATAGSNENTCSGLSIKHQTLSMLVAGALAMRHSETHACRAHCDYEHVTHLVSICWHTCMYVWPSASMSSVNYSNWLAFACMRHFAPQSARHRSCSLNQMREYHVCHVTQDQTPRCQYPVLLCLHHWVSESRDTKAEEASEGAAGSWQERPSHMCCLPT